MATIKQDDLIQSVADALQYISYYHPADYIKNLARAYELEESAAAKDAMAQILINSRMCAEGHRPICQDTGIVTVFLKVGMEVRWDAHDDGRRDGERGCAAGVQPSGQYAARERAGGPGVRTQEYEGQYAGGGERAVRAKAAMWM